MLAHIFKRVAFFETFLKLLFIPLPAIKSLSWLGHLHRSAALLAPLGPLAPLAPIAQLALLALLASLALKVLLNTT